MEGGGGIANTLQLHKAQCALWRLHLFSMACSDNSATLRTGVKKLEHAFWYKSWGPALTCNTVHVRARYASFQPIWIFI